MDLILSIAGGVGLAYIIIVLIGRQALAKQEAPDVMQVVSVKGSDSSIGVGETIVVVRNGKEL